MRPILFIIHPYFQSVNRKESRVMLDNFIIIVSFVLLAVFAIGKRWCDSHVYLKFKDQTIPTKGGY